MESGTLVYCQLLVSCLILCYSILHLMVVKEICTQLLQLTRKVCTMSRINLLGQPETVMSYMERMLQINLAG
jgi:hypothetical protein